jgi:hypothetical protein
MSAKRIIPVTDIMRRYQDLRKLPQDQRLKQAQHLAEHPEELAAEFASSVAHFAPHANLNDHLYPGERAKREFAEEVKRTNDLVLRLEAQEQVIPVDTPDRLMKHDAGPTVTAVATGSLRSDYVDRELLVHRTTSPAAWEDGAPTAAEFGSTSCSPTPSTARPSSLS